MDNKVQFCSLPGTGLSDLVDRFAEESRNYPFETFFVVSTSRLKADVVRKILEKGIPILKDRICTLGELAEFIFSEHLPDLGRISDEESKLIISHIISSNQQSLSLFIDDRRISIKFVQQLKRFISTLIQRKIDYPGCLAGLQSEKSRQLTFIYSNYLKFLSDNNLVDDDILLKRAAECLNKNGISRIRNVFIYGFFEPSPLEKEFLVSIGNFSTMFHYAMPFADNSRIFVDRGEWLPTTQRVLVESNADGAKLSSLFAETPGVDLSKRLFFAKFRDRISEFRAIAQEIRSLIANDVDPANIAVVLPDRDRAARHILDIFPDFKIPYDIRSSSILSHSTIVQAIIDIIEIPAYNYRRNSVVRLLKSPYIRISSESEGMRCLLGYEVDFESRDANIIEGRVDWNKFQDAGINTLFLSLQKLEGERSVGEHIMALRQILCDLNFGSCANYPNEELRQRDARALVSFFEVLDRIEKAYLAIPDTRMDLKDFLAILSIGLSEKRYDARDNNINAVQLMGLREIVHLSYDYIFIPDLVDGEIPRINLSQPFFTGFEIERMGLLTKRDLMRQERYYFLAEILAAKGKLFLSCSSSEQDQPLIPSVFIRDISEYCKMGSWGDGEIIYSTVKQQFDDGRRISRCDYKNIRLIRVPPLDASLIVEKINIENYYRKINYRSEYDGILNNDPAIASDLSSRFNESKVYSPTMFESYGLCPFHFYLKYVLHLNALPDIENEMSSRELGGLFHRIAFRFYANRRKDGGPKVNVQHLANAIEDIKKIAQEEFQKYSFDDDPVWSSLMQRFIGKSEGRKGILDAFVRHEAKGLPSCFSPANFELSIGSTTSMDLSDECSLKYPISLDLGPGEPSRVLIQGRIDRLDVTEDGQFMVIDYKTGTMNPSHKDIASGISFQLPLYIRCIETSFPGMQGIAGTYYVIKGDGDISKKIVLGDKKYIDLFESLGRSHGIKDDYQAIIYSSLSTAKRYIQDMRAGIFHPTVLIGKCPKYCDSKTVCRFNDLRLLESQGVS
jgi:ATP-dependent helicase/nuclease subunit B